jgi:BCCT family betaine/carnitine transporter
VVDQLVALRRHVHRPRQRGRTVREFMTCVLIIPSLVCVLWMAVFGGAAINDMVANPDSCRLRPT